MSERNKPSEDDIFAALAAQLEGDVDFANSMEAANSQLDDADTEDAAPRITIDGMARAYFTESITDVGEKMYEAFVKLCQENGVDVNAHLQSVDDYGNITEMLMLIAYQLKDRLWPGNTISASSAIILDMRGEDDDTAGVIGIPKEEKIIGTFVSPVIGPMPDEAHALAGDGDALPPIGVGLAIENAVTVDEYGETHEGEFTGPVIIALGTIGLTLQRLNYYDEP